MCVHVLCVQAPAEARRRYASPRAGVTGCYGSPNVGARSRALVLGNNGNNGKVIRRAVFLALLWVLK